MYKSYKYRIYPNKPQVELIEKTFCICRLVYNLALQTKITAWESAKISLSAYDLQLQLTELKRDYPWMHEVDSQSLQQSIANVDKSFKNFFKGRGFPNFKKKNASQSFQCPRNTRRVDFDNNTITVPKLYNIRAKINRKFIGDIKTITISRTPTDKYFASVDVEIKNDPINKPSVVNETTIGIDLGLKDFATASNGLKIENPKHLRGSLKRLKCLQRRASRKKKGSNNRKKANKLVAILHERIANQRKDFLHNVTTKLVSDNQAQTFCIEDLNVAGMKQNRSLAQAISDVGWGEFIRQMKYKCDWYGKNLITIGRFAPSSKTCSNCKSINQLLSLRDREWFCSKCGMMHDRDVNAAVNIKNFGLLKHSGKDIPGEPVESRRLRRAKKQEVLSNK